MSDRHCSESARMPLAGFAIAAKNGEPVCPAVIFGATEMGLSAARNLADHGIQVFLIHFGGGKPAVGYSRFLHFINGPDIDDENTVLDFLESLAVRLGDRPVLLPAQDNAVLFIDRYRTALARHYRFYVWESELLQRLGSKTELPDVADEFILPAPKTIAPQTRAEVETAADTLGFPVLVKPEYTNLWWTKAASKLDLNKKAIQANDLGELLDIYERSERVGSRIIAQQIVQGPDTNHMSYMVFVAPDGELQAEVIVRKLRIYPTGFGVGSYDEAIIRQDALEVGRGIVTRLGYRGFASVQLKLDERDEQLYLIEINLRLPVCTELLTRAGLSVPYYYYQTCLDRDYRVAPFRVGQRWMSVSRDLRSMRDYVRTGTCTWAQWLKDVCQRPAFALFRLDDPMPAVIDLWRWLRGTVGNSLFSAKAPPNVNRSKMPT